MLREVWRAVNKFAPVFMGGLGVGALWLDRYDQAAAAFSLAVLLEMWERK